MGAMLDVSGLGKSYGEVEAVAALDFSLAGGDVLALTGSNGAGKSTTLKMLCGVLPPTRGVVSVRGFDVQHDSLAAKQVTAFVPDTPEFLPDLTVQQHLEFTASVYGVPQATGLIDDLLKRFSLWDKRHVTATTLSRGMHQKVLIICAYLQEPQVLLLDEPLSGLDPHSIRLTLETIADLASRDVAIVISSHLLSVVERVCTHVLLLDAGRQRFFGTLDELRSADAQDGTLEGIFLRMTTT